MGEIKINDQISPAEAKIEDIRFALSRKSLLSQMGATDSTFVFCINFDCDHNFRFLEGN